MPVRSQVEITDLVRETRQRLGLTQTQLALIAGSFVSKREPLLRMDGLCSTNSLETANGDIEADGRCQRSWLPLRTRGQDLLESYLEEEVG